MNRTRAVLFLNEWLISLNHLLKRNLSSMCVFSLSLQWWMSLGCGCHGLGLRFGYFLIPVERLSSCVMFSVTLPVFTFSLLLHNCVLLIKQPTVFTLLFFQFVCDFISVPLSCFAPRFLPVLLFAHVFLVCVVALVFALMDSSSFCFCWVPVMSVKVFLFGLCHMQYVCHC